jgi:hypothetical protein
MRPIRQEDLWILYGLAVAWVVVLIPLIALAFTRKHPPQFEFHWGSLGRGLGGWTASWSLVLALVALVLTFGAVGVAVELVSPPTIANQSAGDSAAKPSSEAVKADAPAKTGAAGTTGANGNTEPTAAK